VKRISTFQFRIIQKEMEEIFFDELRKQNWFNILISNVLSEELFISNQ